MICTIDGCTNTVRARGWCPKHYHRWERHGDPLKTAQRLKGEGSYRSDGYKETGVNGKRMLDHRLVMERFLGRPLEAWEVVHHKDENRLNNSIENLEVHTRRSHVQLHLLRRFISNTHAECGKCRVVKPHSDYSPDIHSHKVLKLQSWCKRCKADYATAYARNHR